jgi:hypothetical protein
MASNNTAPWTTGSIAPLFVEGYASQLSYGRAAHTLSLRTPNCDLNFIFWAVSIHTHLVISLSATYEWELVPQLVVLAYVESPLALLTTYG